MLEKYIREFVSICGFIEKNIPEYLTETRLYIEPARLRKMLDKNLFQESDPKLRVWRNLGWLICDSDKPRFTKTIHKEGKTQRVAVLNRTAYKQIAELMEAAVGGIETAEKDR